MDTLTVVRAARVAGLCYIVIIGLGVLQAAFVPPPTSADSASATSDFLFRMGVLSDVALYSLVLVLSVALYVVVRDVDRPLALGALVLRSAEGIVGLSVTALGGLIPLLLLSDSGGGDPATLAAFLALRESALDVILILIGPGGAAFCYLFLRSRFVPRGLAAWGIITYASMILLGSTRLLLPHTPPWITNVLYAQGGLFEVLFGFWLLIKGVDVSALGRLRSAQG